MKRRKERRRNEGEEVNEEIRIVFWNIAGLKKKERKFWDYVEKFDIIGRCET